MNDDYQTLSLILKRLDQIVTNLLKIPAKAIFRSLDLRKNALACVCTQKGALNLLNFLGFFPANPSDENAQVWVLSEGSENRIKFQRALSILKRYDNNNHVECIPRMRSLAITLMILMTLDTHNRPGGV